MKKFTILLLIIEMGFASCKTKTGDINGGAENSLSNEAASYYYTCPMHPSVISDRPGACPVCGMKLVRKTSTVDTLSNHTEMLHLNERQQMLANIHTDTATIKSIASFNTLTGTVVIDEAGVKVVTSKIKGRIEKLFIKNPGSKIERGDEIFQLYSENLLAEENDFIHLLKQKEEFSSQKELIDKMIQSARKKLLLWGLTSNQIADIERSKTASPLISMFSEVSGYLSLIETREGQYVNEGDVLFEVTDLKKVWVEAQFYADEGVSYRNSPSILLSFDALPGETFYGKIVYANPVIENNTKISLVRIGVENPDEKIKPGMMAFVHLTNGEKKTLVVPRSSLILDKMKTIWVQSEPGMFERRMVQTGLENGREVEIISGVNEGDLIVISGAYLLNSEFILKKGGAVKHQH